MDRIGHISRRALCLGTISAPVALASAGAWAQGKAPIVLIPFTPGGATDSFGRAYANGLSTELGEKYIVQNVGGASGALGLARVASAPADGRTLLYTYGNLSLALPFAVKDAPDILRDFEPVIRTVVTQGIIATAPKSQISSLGDLLKIAKAEPGRLTFADYGELTLAHLMRAAAIDMMRIPYKGGGPGVIATISGEVDLYAGSASTLMPQIKAGKLRALAVTSEDRIGELQDVPTVREVLPGFRALNYQGVFVRRGTPPAVIESLYKHSLAVVSKAPFQQQAASQYAAVKPMNPAEFRKFMETDAVDIAAVMRLTQK